MALQPQQKGRPFALHVGSRHRADAALVLASALVRLHLSAESERIDVPALIASAGADTVVYDNGPKQFIAQASAVALAHELEYCVERFARACVGR